METLDYTIIGGIIAALLGGREGLKFWLNGRGGVQPQRSTSTGGDAMTTTGSHPVADHPVTRAECSAHHAQISQELSRQTEKFDTINDSLGALTVEVRSGLGGVRNEAIAAARHEVHDHERRRHSNG